MGFPSIKHVVFQTKFSKVTFFLEKFISFLFSHSVYCFIVLDIQVKLYTFNIKVASKRLTSFKYVLCFSI